ncbi:MAG TPA: right-handed parallel beta-helix repeat-containing protein [Candidatus Saccharimonadales bacterium]|nr:right-handed parallel beta-helix repeat-containing protein [Candidatus Saccharimonadales bacterium]
MAGYVRRGAKSLLHLLPLKVWAGVLCLLLIAGAFGFQNYRALSMLHSAQSLDNSGHYTTAEAKIHSIQLIGVWPSLTKRIHAEQQRNQQLIAVEQKLEEVQRLLKEHKTQAAEDILKSIGKSSTAGAAAAQAQITQLQKSIQTQTQSSTTGAHSTSSTPSHTATGTTGGGTSSGGGGTTGTGTGGGSQTTNGITYLSACPGNLTASGSYVLSADLTQNTTTTPCIDGNGVSGISIDCAGHSIIYVAGPALISFYQAPNFTVKNCHLDTMIGTNISANGTITGNTFAFRPGSSEAQTLGGGGDTFTNNTITNGILLVYLSGNTITGNTISDDPTVTALGTSGVIQLQDSTNNTISGNHIDGSFHGSFGQHGPGADDGFMLINSSNNYISGNTIKNVFDCGIETISQTTGNHFLNNTITSAVYCGIGGWYWNSWLNNVVQGNTVNGSKFLFQIYADTNFSLPASDKPSAFYFQGNQFISNQFLAGLASNTNSANMNYGAPYLPAGVTAITGNNQFQGNNFGKFDTGPNLLPLNAIVDLGGNICSPSAALTCN